jgi:hypothetical protein
MGVGGLQFAFHGFNLQWVTLGAMSVGKVSFAQGFASSVPPDIATYTNAVHARQLRTSMGDFRHWRIIPMPLAPILPCVASPTNPYKNCQNLTGNQCRHGICSLPDKERNRGAER